MTKEAKILIGIAIATILIVVGGALFFGNSATTTPEKDVIVDKSRLIRNDSQQTASQSAKVHLVEFADFQCPACAAYYPVVAQLKEKYKGSINIVFRHFPLNIHKNAIASSKAAEAAGKQGKFYEMEAILYRRQADWENHNEPVKIFTEYAKEIELDLEQFEKDMKAKAISDEINQDLSDGLAVGVNSTPTFYLNGKKLTNVNTFNDFTAVIDPLLK